MTKKARITIGDDVNTVLDKIYCNKWVTHETEEEFVIAPHYPEEDLSYLFVAKSKTIKQEEGAIITAKLLQQLGVVVEDVIDKEIVIDAFVPTKLYNNRVAVSRGATHPSAFKIEHDIDETWYELVTIKSKIMGVLAEEYTLQRSLIMNTLFLPYTQMSDIIATHKADNYGVTPLGLKEKELAPRALLIFTESYDKVESVKGQLTMISPDFVISHKASDVNALGENFAKSRLVTMVITTVMISVMLVLFSILYYIKNRHRRKEVGILKAVGLTERNIMVVIGFEMGTIAFKSFTGALWLTFSLMICGNALFRVDIFSLTATVIVIGFIVCLGISMLASGLPIYLASKADPIEAIREEIK